MAEDGDPPGSPEDGDPPERAGNPEGTPPDREGTQSSPGETQSGRPSLEQYERLLETVPHPVFLIDSRGYLTDSNYAVEHHLGYDTAGDDPLHLSAILADDDVATIIERLRDPPASGPGPHHTTTVEGVTSEGFTRTFAASVTRLSTDGQFEGAAVVLQDITARKRRQEVFTVIDRAFRHNLRTNVTVITTSIGNLQNRLDTHDTALQRIYDAATWIHKLGTSLRTLQTAIDESLTTDATIEVDSLVESAVETATPADGDANVSVSVSVEGRLAAGQPLEYALENVVENAIVHNDAAEPTVSVWAAHADRDGWVDIHVADNGPGIPAFEREIVLGDADIDQLQHGSGLGLWVTRWVVELIDGELFLEDNDPRGTVVTLRLPLADDRPQ